MNNRKNVILSICPGPIEGICEYFHLFHSFMLNEGLCQCAPADSNHSVIQLGLGSVHLRALNIQPIHQPILRL